MRWERAERRLRISSRSPSAATRARRTHEAALMHGPALATAFYFDETHRAGKQRVRALATWGGGGVEGGERGRAWGLRLRTWRRVHAFNTHTRAVGADGILPWGCYWVPLRR